MVNSLAGEHELLLAALAGRVCRRQFAHVVGGQPLFERIVGVVRTLRPQAMLPSTYVGVTISTSKRQLRDRLC